MEITDHPERLTALLRDMGKRIVFRPTEARMLAAQNSLQKFVESFVRHPIK